LFNAFFFQNSNEFSLNGILTEIRQDYFRIISKNGFSKGSFNSPDSQIKIVHKTYIQTEIVEKSRIDAFMSSTCRVIGFIWLLNHVIYLKLTRFFSKIVSFLAVINE
jgi:hypothetical protein